MLTGRRLRSPTGVEGLDSWVTLAAVEGRGSVVGNPVVMVTGEEEGINVLMLGSTEAENKWKDVYSLYKCVCVDVDSSKFMFS